MNSIVRCVIPGLIVLLAACNSTPEQRSHPEGKNSLTGRELMHAQRDGYQVVSREGQKLLCRQHDVTGSHALKAVDCLTTEQWREREYAARDTLQQQRLIKRSPGN